MANKFLRINHWTGNYRASLIVIVIMFFFSFSYGQNNWGVRASANLSKTVSYVYSSPNRLGFSTGIFVEKQITARIFVLEDLGYSLKGSLAYNGSFNLKYLTSSTLLGWNVTSRLSILVGPEFGYLLQANYNSRGFKVIATNEYKQWDIGLQGTVRYIVFRNWGFKYGYIHGLQNIQKSVIYFDNGYATIDEKHNPKNYLHELGVFVYPRK